MAEPTVDRIPSPETMNPKKAVVRELGALLETIRADDDERAPGFFKALAKASAEVGGKMAASTGGQIGQQKYRYLSLATLLDHVKPILAQNGLGLMQRVHVEEGSYGIDTILFSEAGFLFSFGITWIPVGGTRGNDAQQAGSAIQYARRYGLCSALGVVGEEEDDDAKGSETQQRPQQRDQRSSAQQPQEELYPAEPAQYDLQMDEPPCPKRGPAPARQRPSQARLGRLIQQIDGVATGIQMKPEELREEVKRAAGVRSGKDLHVDLFDAPPPQGETAWKGRWLSHWLGWREDQVLKPRAEAAEKQEDETKGEF